MKTKHLLMFPFVVASILGQAQEKEVKKAKTVVESFIKAGDSGNADMVSTFLDSNFQVVMNRLFGSDAVVVVSREVYLSKIASGEWGGDSRQIEFEETIFNNSSCVVKVRLEGSKMTFLSVLTLIKDENGEWKILSDVPFVAGK